MGTEFYIIIGIALSISFLIFMKTKVTKEWSNKVPDEPDYWKGGLFYYNPNDRRVFLPNRIGLGFTLNFANPVSKIIVVILILMMILAPLLSK